MLLIRTSEAIKSEILMTMFICAQDGEGNDTWAGKTCKCDCDSSGKLLSKGSYSGQEMDCMPGKKEKGTLRNMDSKNHIAVFSKP